MGTQGHQSSNIDPQDMEQEVTDVNTDAGKVNAQSSEGDAAEDEMSHDELLLTLQDARAKADEHWNQLLRARAELENYKRRAERELENAHRYGLEKVAKELLPIKDSMELGLAAAEGVGDDSQKVKEGIELTLKMFDSLMNKIGITEINPVGEKFNPEFHQAMTMQEAPDREPNTVLTVYQKGYLLNDRLIRPAMVVVSAAANKNDSN